MNEPAKLLIKFATRGRPHRFLKTMNSIHSMVAHPDYAFILITCDQDDLLMNNSEMRDYIAGCKNAHVIYGESHCKVHAINRDFDKVPDPWKDWQICSNVSDDMQYSLFGFDECLRVDFKERFPDYDGYLSYLDRDTKGVLTTQLNIGRKYFDRFGFLYNPAYKSLFCDNEADEIAKILGKYFFTGYEIYRHYNSAYGYPEYPKDEMFLRQQELGWDIDQKTYYERKRRNFDIVTDEDKVTLNKLNEQL